MTDKSSQEKLLVNRYQLIELVGTGAMGKVYRAKDKASNGLDVAVKILSRSLDDKKMIKQFQREATISALLSERSINIVKVQDYGVDETQVPFYVMEFLEGESLSDFIQFHDIPLLKFLNLTRQICLAMETAHNGIFFEGEICPIIHRDLKPSNIFIVEDEAKGDLIKVLDFGIAQLSHPEGEKTKGFVGTPRYCSPEQIQGKDLDNRSDIYSLGVVLYEMLEKKMPWELEDKLIGSWYKAHTQMIPNDFSPQLKIPLDLKELIMRCLAKSPNDRPQSVGEIIQVLDNVTQRLQKKLLLKNNRHIIASQNTNAPYQGKLVSELEKIYLNSAWPENKPQQKIVFPAITTHNESFFPSLWTMLEEEDFHNYQYNIRYNKFMFQSYPHPMILWITVLYSMKNGPRWLPCYLDLKTKMGQEVTNALSNSKEYHVLLFAVNKPDKCQEILSLKVLLKQRTMLKKWASVGKLLILNDSSKAVISKRKLKQDFENLKPEIILEIQKSSTQEIHK